MKYIFIINMLVNNINVMMIIVIWRLIFKIGSLFEVIGRKDGIMSRNIVMVRRIVVIKLICFLFLMWIRKLFSVRMVSKIEGIVR